MTQILYSIQEEDPINIDDIVDDDEDNMELKMKLVRVLRLFFMLQDCNNFNFVTENEKATPTFSTHIHCVQQIRDLGEIFEDLGRQLMPSILKHCGI